MKLKDCKHGILVKTKDANPKVGMIIGITNNRESASESERAGEAFAIPLVQWSHKPAHGIHHGNIEPL